MSSSCIGRAVSRVAGQRATAVAAVGRRSVATGCRRHPSGNCCCVARSFSTSPTQQKQPPSPPPEIPGRFDAAEVYAKLRPFSEQDKVHSVAFQDYLNRAVDEEVHPDWQKELMQYGSTDKHYETDRIDDGTDKIQRRNYTYVAVGGGRFLYGTFVRGTVMAMITSMSASSDVLALASVEIEMSSIPVSGCATFKWRGKPVMIRHRSQQEIDESVNTPMEELKDPQRDEDRAINPEFLVVVGVCTHLGCVPIPNAGSYKGWFCPCHGSHYDLSGRIRKGPAPLNLEVPEYRYIGDTTIVVG